MIKLLKLRLKGCIGQCPKMHSDSKIDTPPTKLTPLSIGGVTRLSLDYQESSTTLVFDYETCPRTLLDIPAYIRVLVECFEAL